MVKLKLSWAREGVRSRGSSAIARLRENMLTHKVSPTLVDGGGEKRETAKERKQAGCWNRGARAAGYLAAVPLSEGIHETRNAKSKAGSGCRLGRGGPRSLYASIERDWRGVPDSWDSGEAEKMEDAGECPARREDETRRRRFPVLRHGDLRHGVFRVPSCPGRLRDGGMNDEQRSWRQDSRRK